MNSVCKIRILSVLICVMSYVACSANVIPISPDTIVIRRVVRDVKMPARIASQINIYDMPYSRDASYRNWKRLWINTGALYSAGIVALAVLENLPEDATNWNREELSGVAPLKRWGNHVKQVAHWDGDNPIFNYILHPYGGAAYFMSARSQGFNFWASSLYCFCISTFFWEYGIEAFMEVPSIQDLIITPVAGAVLGECFYKWKRRIVADGYEVLGSRVLGYIVAFVIDPVNEFVGLFAGNPCKQSVKENHKKTEIALLPTFTTTQKRLNYGFALNIVF